MQGNFSVDGNAFSMREREIQIAHAFACKLLACKFHGLFDMLIIEIASGYQACIKIEKLSVRALAFRQH